MEQLTNKQSKDYESLKLEADRLKTQYEKESKSAGDMAQSLQNQLASEQSKNANSIASFQEDIKAKEREMSQLQSTDAERSTIASMQSKLEAYQRDSERMIENNKMKIASMKTDFDKQLAGGQAEHRAQLEQIEQKLQADIGRLQQDLYTRAAKIDDLTKSLDASQVSNKKLSGEIVGLNTQRLSAESLLKDSTTKMEVAKRDIERLKQQLQEAKTVDATNMTKIRALENELNERTAQLGRLQVGSKQHATEKERLLAELSNLKNWKDSAQLAINALSNEVALNSISGEIANLQGGSIDTIIDKLSGIRNELSWKDAELDIAKSDTDKLLKEQPAEQAVVEKQPVTIDNRPASPTPGAVGSSLGRKASVQGVNIDGGFGTRHRNVAPKGAATNAPMSGRPAENQGGGYLDNL